MSWLYGFYHKEAVERTLPVLHLQPVLHEFHGKAIDVFAGGSSATLSWLKLPQNGFLAILGMPVLLDRGEFRYPTEMDWIWFINHPEAFLNLDGHFAIIHFDSHKLRFYNDPLGKRSLYFRETDRGYFFCSDLTLLKRHGKTELDFYRFGALWHSLYPPTQGGYAPLAEGYYKGVRMLGSGANAVIDTQTNTLQIDNHFFSPGSVAYDPQKLLQSYCLLPHRSGRRIGIGLSGGMDIRPLLAIYLHADVPLTIYNYGNKDNYDYQVASNIAKRFSLPFRHITYEDAEADWQQVLDFMTDRGVVFNPLHSANLGYYPIVAQETEAYVSGYFGEVFRFRMMAAILKSTLAAKQLDYHNISAYLYRKPPSFFNSDAMRVMHKGFWDHLKLAVSEMPSPNEMLNPYWMHLFVIRYWFRTLQAVNYPCIDMQVQNILPWVQPTIFSQHWHMGFFKQLNEGLHRGIIRNLYPALEDFPLSATDVIAPYKTRQLVLKLKSWVYYRKHPRCREFRTTAFLNKHQQRIIELLNSQDVKQDSALDYSKVTSIVSGFYAGDATLQNALVSFLAYTLGK